MSNIKFIYFDIGGVLADYVFALRKLAQELAIPEQQLLDLFHQHVDKIDRGSLSWAEFEKIAYQKLETKKKLDKPLSYYFTSYFNTITETHQLIQEIKDQFPLGILSNVPEDIFQLLKEASFIPNIDFQSLVISAHIGKIKPEKEIFDYALEQIKLPANEVLFIDDKKENTDAAAKLGWNTVLFETNNPQKSVEEIREMIS